MLKMHILQEIYTPNMLKAKIYYLGYLRKVDIIQAYEIMLVTSKTQARDYLDTCIRLNRNRYNMKRLDLNTLKYIEYDREVIERMFK